MAVRANPIPLIQGGWYFLSFVSFIIGPIIFLFATNLITSPKEVDEAPMGSYYFEQGQRFFLLLGLVQAWTIGLDVVFNSISYPTYITMDIGTLLLLLMMSKNHRLHVASLAVLLLAFLIRSILQALAG